MFSASVTRRNILRSAAILPIGVATSACALFTRDLSPLCTNQPPFNSVNSPLTVDMHMHVFNGSDLQVKAFLTRVVIQEAKFKAAVDALGGVIENIVWTSAPTGDEELAQYPRLAQALRSCSPDKFVTDFSSPSAQGQAPTIAAAMRNAAYSRGVTELREALRRSQSTLGVRSVASSAVRQIEQLPNDYDDYTRSHFRIARASAKDSRIAGIIAFLLNNFQYRYTNAFSYFQDYGQGADRSVDLAVCHLVDYDLPLGKGRQTETPFSDQIKVMQEIAVLTDGRVHYFAPFDPMKDALSDGATLRMAQQAVQNQGAIGVKLYPPMGFAPIGNAALPAGFWDQAWLPDFVRNDAAFGAKLDKSLHALYAWCQQEHVPIMAHTNRSNGPSDAFKELVAARHWRAVLDAYQDLRIDFGHFGDTSPGTHGGARTWPFAALMQTPPLAGGFAYADSGYFSEVFSDEAQLAKVLSDLYAATAHKGDAALSRRLMYGSDWQMILMEGRFRENYLRRFERVFSSLGLSRSGTLGNDFFGLNAMNFLGLSKGQATRERLDAFYARRAVPPPAWMKKVDDVALHASTVGSRANLVT